MIFGIGSRVHLRTCPHGEPGIVRSASNGRVLVDWRDLGMEGRHLIDRLELAGDVPEASSSETPEMRVDSSAESIVCNTQFRLTFGT